jgi:hypothetical protein
VVEREYTLGVMFYRGKISYSKNGVVVAHWASTSLATKRLAPAVSLNTDEQVVVNLGDGTGQGGFKCLPEGYVGVSSLMKIGGDEESGGEDEIGEEEEEEEMVVVEEIVEEEKVAAVEEKVVAVADPLTLEDVRKYASAEALAANSMDVLKATLQSLGLKAGGGLIERAERLWLVKDMQREDIPGKVRDKSTFEQVTKMQEGSSKR